MTKIHGRIDSFSNLIDMVSTNLEAVHDLGGLVIVEWRVSTSVDTTLRGEIPAQSDTNVISDLFG